jgi:hypothetical protein
MLLNTALKCSCSNEGHSLVPVFATMCELSIPTSIAQDRVYSNIVFFYFIDSINASVAACCTGCMRFFRLL